jgi:4-nitrophenyl phosphatase
MPSIGRPAATIVDVNDEKSPSGPPAPWSTVRTVLCDLDGVVWLAHRPIPGSVEAIAALRASGRRVMFVTNNSAARLGDHHAALEEIGITASGDVVSSAMAAARLVEPGERVLVAGGPGVVEAVVARGALAVSNDGVVAPEGFDAVVVGLHRDFDFARLSVASAAVRAGARLIGTNTDSTYPTPTGLQPGGGAILAAIATAADTEPIVGGKPHQPMADLIAELISGSGSGDALDPSTVVMVGDRPETDGLFATRLGCRFALVRTGVTGAGAAETISTTDVRSRQFGDVAVHLDARDLHAVAQHIVTVPEPEQ